MAYLLKPHLQEVLRAYIRELELAETREDGQPASVRGLLERRPHPIITTPSPYLPTHDSPKEISPNLDHPPPYPSDSLAVAKVDEADDSSTASSSPSRTLITTNDLLTPDLPTQFNGMYVSPAVMQAIQSYDPQPQSSSPDHHRLSSPADAAAQAALGSSPRFVPPLPAYSESPHGAAPRLQPDQNGREIPPDATWTRIRRTLVSPVVLDRAGVRYEARPDFVAVLGVLSREEIREFAKQSEEVRRARYSRAPPPPRERAPYPVSASDWSGSSSSSSSGSDSDSPSPPLPPRRGGEGDRIGGEVEDKGTRSYPFIVQPPSEGEEPTSPASTVKPKPILKNKNENRVHFGPEPYETPREDRRERERDDEGRRRRRRRRDHDRERDYDRDSRDKERDRDRDHDRDREHRRRHSHRDSHRDSRDGHRDRKRSGRDALYAAGLGGAAASLMGVLAEAASAL